MRRERIMRRSSSPRRPRSCPETTNGLLSVDLEREVPERLKPRMIEIGASVAKGDKTVDASVAA